MNQVSNARTDLAMVSGQYGSHKANAARELNAVTNFIHNLYPQTVHMGNLKASTNQTAKLQGSQADHKLQQAQRAIQNAVSVIHSTGNSSKGNQILLTKLANASREIDLAISYHGSSTSLAKK